MAKEINNAELAEQVISLERSKLSLEAKRIEQEDKKLEHWSKIEQTRITYSSGQYDKERVFKYFVVSILFLAFLVFLIALSINTELISLLKDAGKVILGVIVGYAIKVLRLKNKS